MRRTRPAQIVEVPPQEPAAAPAARLGWIAGVSADGLALVDHVGNGAAPLAARSTVVLGRAALETAAARRQPVVLLFDGGDPARPIIVGLVVDRAPAAEAPVLAEVSRAARPEVAEVDGRRVCIEGEDEIVLRCGEASITLRRNGKVVLRGTYLESHAQGTNRIKGGSVQIN